MAQSDSDSRAPEPLNGILTSLPTYPTLKTACSSNNIEEEKRFLISDLCHILEGYLSAEQIADIYKAYLYGAQMHEGQKRASGEPYIYHPIAVARIMAEMHMDYQSIVAALLHDVIEDTGAAKEQIAEKFGVDVAELVDGVSKLTQIQFRSKAEAQAENFSKMLLAMAQDIRVIIIKLADRLHNMRTLGSMRPEKRRRISRETTEIYAPIANRLGIYEMRHELLDLAIYHSFPMRYKAIENACAAITGHRKEVFTTIKSSLKNRFKEAKISTKIKYRRKNIHSIYRKMRDKKLSFKEITDLYGVRISVKSVDHCYRILGMCHNLYKPIPGKFKDYIAIPKANGYQSLHTSLFGPHGIPIEIQIRTEEMDQFAQSGIAAHWLYKESGVDSLDRASRASEWLNGLLELQQNTSSSLEFLENVKVDLFPDEVYVFTPTGDIKKLPRGSTIVDFAYSVHSDVGHTCVAARVDHKMKPLNSEIFNGQTVQVITSKSSRPHPNWLDFIITARARTQIRHYLKSIKQSEAISLGRRLLKQSIISYMGSELEYAVEKINDLLVKYHLTTEDELLAEIGLGNRNSNLVVKSLFDTFDDDDITQFDESGNPLAIKGTEGMVLSYAHCCRPIPGDQIIGYFSSGKGIVVHKHSCKNVTKEQKSDFRVMDIQWSEHVEGEFSVGIRVQVINQRGVLAKLAAIIADTNSNIDNLEMSDESGSLTTINFVISVKNRVHLAHIMRKLKQVKVVNKIKRGTS
ncbi:MAG: RelA/SpoT family protein [Gammaproteobacteria bacterium]|nr:RelA/SpoT family protein [Gammaproteobacteria bacterium]